MTLRRFFLFLFIITLLLNSGKGNISYSSEKNIELIDELDFVHNLNNIEEWVEDEKENQEEIRIDQLLVDPEEIEEGQELVEDMEGDGYEDEDLIEEVEIIEFDINGLQLREGIASDQVLRIKRFLIEKGYKDIEEGYYFDNATKKAVIDYQKENGLKPDGIIGPLTFTSINEDMKENKISLREIVLALPEIVPSGKWILINKESNTLYHYEDRQLIDKYPIASGKTPSHTPEGEFTIIRKFINPAWGGAGRYTPIKGGAPNNPLGKRWLGLSIGGGGTYGIHGNADVYSIGKYVSLGCIRMFNEDVEHLYDLVEYHTPVWILASLPEEENSPDISEIGEEKLEDLYEDEENLKEDELEEIDPVEEVGLD